MNLLYLVHTLIYIMDIYKTANCTKCFYMIFIIIVNYYSLLIYFPYVTCARSQDRILLFRHCLLGFLVHYYSAIPFHIGERALECHLPIKFSEQKRFRKIRRRKKLQLQFRYAPLKSRSYKRLLLLAAFSWIGIVIPSSLVPVLNHGSRCWALT